MKKTITLIGLFLMLLTASAWAEDATWTFKWDTSKSNGGEGFYHITSNEETTQQTTLNTLQWTFSSNTSVTAFTGTAGQYFGSAKSPVFNGTLSTAYLSGKIKSVTVEAKKKDGATVNIGVSVNGVSYKHDASTTADLTNEWASYAFAPTGEPAEGEIVITMTQAEETPGPIYFLSLTIVYEGEGVVTPPVEKVSPELKYELQEYKVEAGDDVVANYLTNPHNVAPITYTIRDQTIAVLGSTGNVFTTGKVGKTTVKASFAGDDNYLPGEATYTLVVVAKPVIPEPSVDLPSGTYTEAKKVTIKSDDPNCKAIWYSTVAKDSLDLVDNPVIVAGNVAVVTLNESCTLRACAVDYNNIGCVAVCDYVFNIPLQANFGAEESKTVYYSQGWDSIEEASTWRYYGISNTTWTMTETPFLSGTQPFTVIDPESAYSLSINYTNSDQRERAVSPEIEVRENSEVEFYACFSGIWLVFADWKLNVHDLTTGTTDQLLSAFMWAQNNEFTGPNWVKFNFDLSKYAGHKCQFEFLYEGNDGDALSIDGFKITQEDTSADAKINIMQGGTVHFRDMSQGHPDLWLWTFEGADITSSTEQNPVVTYSKAGKYAVTLAVAKGAEKSSVTRQEYIIVNVEAPQAHIGIPDEAYLSPYTAAFVPVGVPVTFRDESKGMPDTWYWTFEGADIADSAEKNPTVTYNAEGTYGLVLTVSNGAGTDRDFLVNAVQAGGSAEVWNIAPEENGELGVVSLGWYGYYAGTNWLGMRSFAEHMHKPAAPASIDEVVVYFNAVDAEDQNAEITVSIALPDANGMPGTVLGTTALKVSELNCDAHMVVPTNFVFDTPVEVSTDFFVVISGFPNTGNNDNVSVLCCYRGEDGKNTSYHELEDEDASYNPLGTYTWYENSDEPLSIAMTANMTYKNDIAGICQPHTVMSEGAEAFFDITGVRQKGVSKSGIYIRRGGDAVRKIMVK